MAALTAAARPINNGLILLACSGTTGAEILDSGENAIVSVVEQSSAVSDSSAICIFIVQVLERENLAYIRIAGDEILSD